MPSVQKQFEDFHSAICFDEDDEKATLREKRDTIVKALREKLGADVPTCRRSSTSIRAVTPCTPV